MNQGVSLRAVLDGGISLSSSDAVGIVQSLIVAPADEPSSAPAPTAPSPDNVHIRADGSVVWLGAAATPSVSECAILLDALVPPGRTPASGAVRYLIARALLEVDAPPFDSIAAFSAALSRHEPESRVAAVQALFARVRRVAPTAVAVERRRTPASTTVLRRHLRDADAAMFAARAMGDPRPLPIESARAGQPAVWALAGAAAALAAFGSGYAVMHRVRAAQPSAEHRQSFSMTDAPRVPAPPRAMTSAPVSPSPTASRAANMATTATVQAPPASPASPAPPAPAVARLVGPEAGDVFSPSFSSDGTAVFFHAGRSTDERTSLESAATAGDDLRVIKILDEGSRNYHVQPSPNGDLVAFDSDRDGVRGVYTANRDGTDVRRVSGPGYAAVPTWSPDGRTLAMVRSEAGQDRVWNLWLLRLDTGESRRLTAFRFGQTWSGSWFPDGRRLAYTHEDRLFVRDIATGEETVYPAPVAGRLVRTPAVSPDGRAIIFQVARAGAWLLDLRDGSMRCVLTDPSAEEFAWAPDGRRVAFHTRRDGQWGIWRVALQP